MEVAGLAGPLLGLSSIIAKAKKPRGRQKDATQAETPLSSFGLITLYEHPQPTVDIVLVPGLQGHATKAWTVLDVCWPRDLLPKQLPTARVLAFGYSALVGNCTPLSIRDLRKTLLESLSINRRHNKAATRPLIFVADSLGGVLVKSTLVYSHDLDTVDKDSHQIFKATIGCIFFGTPHIKFRSSWAQTSSLISRALAAQSPSTSQLPAFVSGVVEAEDILQLSSAFIQQARQLQLVSCVETLTTSTNRGKLLIVPREDAVMGLRGEVVIPVEADHMTMTKFADDTGPAYQQVVREILGMLGSGPKKAIELSKLVAQLSYSMLTIAVKSEVERHRTPNFDDQHSRDEEDGSDLVGKQHYHTCRHSTFLKSNIEYERRFLSNLRSDWLDEVMIGDNSPGTCKWVLDSRPFEAWLSRIEPTLRILGDPGVGKTVLAKFLYRQLCKAFSYSSDSPTTHAPELTPLNTTKFPRPRHIFAYFFDIKSSARNSGLSALQSLLYQILSTEQELFKYIHLKPIFSRPQRTKFGQYVEVLNDILHDPSMQGTVIVLDALDECEEDSRLPVFKVLSNLAEQSCIQLLVTSRSKWDFNSYLTIDLNDFVEHVNLDVKKYVHTAVKELADAEEFSPELESDIITKLLQQSSGSFLWVQLVLQSVSKARTVRMVRNVLEQLPKDLKESYAVAFNGATGFTGINMRRTLYFVTVAKIPLQLKEVSALLALSQCWENPSSTFLNRSKTPDVSMISDMKEITENQTMSLQRDLKSHFQPLLSVKDGSISLVHSTLREFLEQEAGTNLRAIFNFPHLSFTRFGLSDVHTMVAILCLQYMLASFRENHDPLGFMDFACLYWTEYARESRGNLTWLLKNMMKILFWGSPNFGSIWLDYVLDANTMPLALLPKNTDLAFVLAAFDLANVFGTTFHISIQDLESTNQDRQTPLHYAAANNALSSTQWFQRLYGVAGKKFGDLATMKDIHGQSPISLAAHNGHHALVKFLLSSAGSNHVFELKLFRTIADTGNREMFETLHEHTNFEFPDQRLSLLTSAVKLNKVGLVKKIYDEYDSQGNLPGTTATTDGADDDPLLHVALQRHAYDVLDFLFDMKGYRDLIDKQGNTVLHIAAQEGSEKTAHRLLKAGIAVDTINERGETPLHVASSIGLPAMVRLLCESGANVNIPGPSGCSPAHLATKTGHKEIIDILLHYGGNIFATDDDGRSALHVATEAGQKAILAALLGYGADLIVQDFQGRTSVHYAVQSGDLSILYMLCGAGADPSSLDLENTAPLHIAAERGSEIIVRELLCLGSDPNPQDSKGRTPLHYGCLAKRSTRTIVKTLLEAGADVSALDLENVSSLHLAAEQGHSALVHDLIRSGALVCCEDSNGRTPLHYGCRSNSPTAAAIKLLIEAGADVNNQDHVGLSPLHDACLSEYVEEDIVRLLLDSGAKTDQAKLDGKLPFHYGIQKGKVRIVKLSLQSGPTVPTADMEEWTALGWT